MIQMVEVETKNPLETEIRKEYDKTLMTFIQRMKDVDLKKIETEKMNFEEKSSSISYRFSVIRDIYEMVTALKNMERILDFYDELDLVPAEQVISDLKMGLMEP